MYYVTRYVCITYKFISVLGPIITKLMGVNK